MPPDTITRLEMVRTPDSGVQVLVKAAAVLDLLAARGAMSAAGLALELGEPRSSVYRLLGTLQRLELVEAGERRGEYRLGLKLLRLGGAVAGRFDVREAALEVMRELHDATGETVFLCVRRSFEAVCIERLDGREVNVLALQLGGALPLHVGGAPRTLLAFEPPASWEPTLRAMSLDAFTERTPTAIADVIGGLEEARRTGYTVSDEDVTPGVAALGAPIFDRRGAVCAALSIAGVRPRILGEESGPVLDRLLASAAAISRRLGHDARRSA
jgi:DNA-binding IclR family transcriptional regulator